jgi:hypothetical protein
MEFILNKEQFQEAQKHWKKFAQARKATSSDMLIYNLIRGKAADFGFTPISNKRKLDNNGNDPFQNFKLAKSNARYELKWNQTPLETIFGSIMKDEKILDRIKELVQ